MHLLSLKNTLMVTLMVWKYAVQLAGLCVFCLMPPFVDVAQSKKHFFARKSKASRSDLFKVMQAKSCFS